MSETIRARMLLARMYGDTEPTVVDCVDEAIWENWTDADELEWVEAGKKRWGIERDTEFRVVTAAFAPQSLVDAFEFPVVEGWVV